MADLDDLLAKTSRTFALAIPLLPEPTRKAVSLAYLLFRIADTFEDATEWPRARRLHALETFASLLETNRAGLTAETKRWLDEPPTKHDGYLELLREVPAVVAELDGLAPGVRAILVKHTQRTSRGMAEVVSKADDRGHFKLTTLEDLTDYCYVVAGIVGELLTEVFVHDAPSLRAVAHELESRQIAFGEGLQLVNILKDASDDAVDGRAYLPRAVPREQVFALAREDLDRAAEYVDALQRGGAPRGFLAFTALPVMLARAALRAIEQQGPGAKVPRTQVAALYQTLETTLDAGGSLKVATA